MAVAQNVTSLSHAVALYEKNFSTHPFWYLFAGKNTNAAARIASWEILGERDDVKQHVDTINFTLEGYGDGYYTLLTRKKPNDTASQQPYLFKKGEGFDIEMDLGFGKIGGMSNSNPMQMLMMQAMIKGLSGDSNAAVVGLQKDIELMKLQFEHQREIEKERSNVGSRIMGLIENNFDSILGKLPNLELPKVKSNIPAPSGQGSTTQKTETSDVPSGRAMHELPLEYQPNKVSADAMVHYAKEFSKHHPNVNPSILFAKIVAFAAAQPEMAKGLFSQLDASVGEIGSDE